MPVWRQNRVSAHDEPQINLHVLLPNPTMPRRIVSSQHRNRRLSSWSHLLEMNRFYARTFYLLRSFHRGKKKSNARKLVSPKYILQFFEKEIRERLLKLSSDNILPFRFRSNANESSNDDERITSTYSTKSIKKNDEHYRRHPGRRDPEWSVRTTTSDNWFFRGAWFKGRDIETVGGDRGGVRLVAGLLEFRRGGVSRASISPRFSAVETVATGRSENPERNGSGVCSSGVEKRKKRGRRGRIQSQKK